MSEAWDKNVDARSRKIKRKPDRVGVTDLAWLPRALYLGVMADVAAKSHMMIAKKLVRKSSVSVELGAVPILNKFDSTDWDDQSGQTTTWTVYP